MKNLITENELAEEMATILSDEIIASFSCDKNVLQIKFPNGQEFILTVKNSK